MPTTPPIDQPADSHRRLRAGRRPSMMPDDARATSAAAPATRSRCPTTWRPGGGWRCARGCSSARAARPERDAARACAARTRSSSRRRRFSALAHPDGEIGDRPGGGGDRHGHVPVDARQRRPGSAVAEACRRRRAGFSSTSSPTAASAASSSRRRSAEGYEALVVTVDRPVLGVRERELRAGCAPCAESRPAPAAGARGDHAGGVRRADRPGPALD